MTSTQSSTVKVIKVNNIFFKLNKRRIIVFRIANPYNILRQITNLTQLSVEVSARQRRVETSTNRLFHHNNFPCRVAANFDHISACCRNIKTQRCTVVLLGGKQTSVEVEERHRIAVCPLDHYLPLA